MGAGSSASGAGAIRFAYGTSRIVTRRQLHRRHHRDPDSGDPPTRHNANTSALRLTGGTRGGTGTLTVGTGQSASPGRLQRPRPDHHQRLPDHHHRLVELNASAPTVRLGGGTTWTAGNVQISNAGIVERRPVTVTGSVGVDLHGSAAAARCACSRAAYEISGAFTVGTELENDGTLRALTGGH